MEKIFNSGLNISDHKGIITRQENAPLALPVKLKTQSNELEKQID